MRHLLLPFTVAAILLALPRAAEAGGGCGKVTFQGFCEDTVLTWCNVDEVVVTDCAEVLGEGGSCITLDEEYGSDCAVAVGAECIIDVGGGQVASTFCQGNEPGCVITPLETQTSSCTQNVGPCMEGETGCRDNLFIIDCLVNQPVAIACDSLGGRCENTGCVDLAAGSPCGPSLECAAGLACDANGTCSTPPPDAGVIDSGAAPDAAGPAPDGGSTAQDASATPDAGTPPADAATGMDAAGTPGPGGNDRDKGCGCTASEQGAASALALLFLLLPALVRRKRS